MQSGQHFGGSAVGVHKNMQVNIKVRSVFTILQWGNFNVVHENMQGDIKIWSVIYFPKKVIRNNSTIPNLDLVHKNMQVSIKVRSVFTTPMRKFRYGT